MSNKKYYFKMEPRELMRQIVELYREARKPRYYHPKVKRGQSRSISGLSEDLFAYFLAVNLIEDYEFYTDQTITFDKSVTIKSIRPDVTIVQNNAVKDIIDLKMDLGWKRGEFGNFCLDLSNKVNVIKGKNGNIRPLNPDGMSTTQKLLSFSENLVFHIVLISKLNISESKLNEHLNFIKNSKISNVKVYILSSEVHPNKYGKFVEDVVKSIKIQDDEFIRLLNNLT